MHVDSIDDLPSRLAKRLARPVASRPGLSRFAAAMNYGRQLGPPPPDSRQAAVLLLLYRHSNRWYLPLTLRPDHLPDHGGQISLPGGVRENGEPCRTTALRELEEEIHVSADQVEIVGRLARTYVFSTNYRICSWVAVSRSRPAMRPNPAEVVEIFEVPLAHLLDPANHGHRRLQEGRLSLTAPHISWQGHHIWGATGIILGQLIAVLEELTGCA